MALERLLDAGAHSNGVATRIACHQPKINHGPDCAAPAVHGAPRPGAACRARGRISLPTPTTAGAMRRGLRAHLVALVASALLPAFAVGAIAVGAAVDSYRRSFEDRLQGTAGALASAVDAEIDAHVLALSTLAASHGFDEGGGGDLAAFHARARRTAAVLGNSVFVVAPDLSLALHTHFPPDRAFAREPARHLVGAARRVFETGRPAVGDLIRGRVTGREVAPVYVPVSRGGEVAYALGAVMEADRIARLLGEQPFRAGGWVFEGTRGGGSGVLRGANLGGVEITTAFRGVAQAPGWVVTVAEPRSTTAADLWRPLATLAFGALGALAVALLVAVVIGGRVLRPVDWLTHKAERVAASGGDVEIVPEGPPVRVRDFERLRAAVVQAHVALQKRASAVAAGEARLRAVVDTAADAIVVIDERGAIRSFNPAAEAIFGDAAGEAVGRDVSMLVGGVHHRAAAHHHAALTLRLPLHGLPLHARPWRRACPFRSRQGRTCRPALASSAPCRPAACRRAAAGRPGRRRPPWPEPRPARRRAR